MSSRPGFMAIPLFDRFRPHVAALLLLLAVTAVVHGSILGHDFIPTWDDNQYVTDNPAAHGFSAAHLKDAFTKVYSGNYAPLQIVSYMLDYELWGLRPAGYLLTNLLLHTACGLFWYAIVFRLTRRRLWAMVAAGLFLLHPLQVESVAWISQRKNVLSLFFFLGAVQCYLAAALRNGRARRLFQAASLAAFVLALLTKSVAVILPLVLVVYDCCYQGDKRWRSVLTDKLAYFAVALLCGLLAMASQADYGAGGGRFPYHGGTPWITLLTMLPVLARYLILFLWPYGLSLIYAPPLKRVVDADVLLAGVLLALLLVVGLWLFRRRRDLFFWFALCVIGFLPVVQIVPLITLMNDRYCYYPLLGFGALVGALATFLVDGLPRNRLLLVPALFVAGYLVAMPIMARQRTAVWQDQITLWRDTYLKTPQVLTGYDPELTRDKLVAAYCQKGESLHLQGRYPEARQYYLLALARDPQAHDALNNYAVLLLDQDKPLAAMHYLRTLTQVFPRSYKGYLNLGDSFVMTGQFAEADAAYDKALRLSPGNPKILAARGRAAEAGQDFTAAADRYSEAVASGGDDPDVLVRLAALAMRRGDRGSAMAWLAKALQKGFSDRSAIEADPYLRTLRGDPAYQRLLTSSGLDK